MTRPPPEVWAIMAFIGTIFLFIGAFSTVFPGWWRTVCKGLLIIDAATVYADYRYRRELARNCLAPEGGTTEEEE